MVISEPWVWIKLMGNFEVYIHNLQQSLGQTAPSAWKCPKTQFWGTLTNWKFEPSPRPHTHSDPIINKHTEQVKKTTYGFIRVYMHWPPCNKPKLSNTLKSKDLAILAFKKKFQTHPPKLAEVESSFREVSLPPAKLGMLFPLTSGLESFGDKSTPSDRPWIEDWGLLSKILASTKKGGT